MRPLLCALFGALWGLAFYANLLPVFERRVGVRVAGWLALAAGIVVALAFTGFLIHTL